MYWKTCPNCKGGEWLETPDGDMRCPDCYGNDCPGLVPVGEGTIIIEDVEVQIAEVLMSAAVTVGGINPGIAADLTAEAIRVLRGSAAGEKP